MSGGQWRAIMVVAVVVLGGLSLVLRWTPARPVRASPLPLLQPTGVADWSAETAGWAPRAVPFGADRYPKVYENLKLMGSDGVPDSAAGTFVTPWYRCRGSLVVAVAGFPGAAGNELHLDIRHADGRETSERYQSGDPGYCWRGWGMDLPSSAVAVRVRAINQSQGPEGWMGVGEPAEYRTDVMLFLWSTGQIIGTIALTLAVVLGPGLLWSARREGGWLPVLWLGPILLMAGGAMAWLFGQLISPVAFSFAWVAMTWTVTSWVGIRRRVWQSWRRAEVPVLALVALCLLGVASRAAVSTGPPDEQFAGTISRTLEMGARPDSRISFHGVQLVAHHLHPYGEQAKIFYWPWSYSSRGPLAGLAAAPLALAVSGTPPDIMPERAWVPFDRHGFAAFRIVIGMLGALGLVSVFIVLRIVSAEKPAMLGAGFVALAPFFWHELYYTWPKLAAAGWTIGAFCLLWQRRYCLSGVALGGAYLLHPVALLSAPLGVLWPFVQRATSLRVRVVRSAAFLGGVASIVCLWQLLNLRHVAQDVFLHYIVAFDGTSGSWLQSRWDNILNTLVPFHAATINGRHGGFPVPSEGSSMLLRVFYQYWLSAPFAVGLVTFCALLPAWIRALREQAGPAVFFLIGPFLLLAGYWGGVSLGLMREGGHVLFLSGWVFLVWSGHQFIPRWTVGRPFLALRGLEILGMLYATMLAAPWRSFDAVWVFNDCFWGTLSILSIAAIVIVIHRSMSGSRFDHEETSP